MNYQQHRGERGQSLIQVVLSMVAFFLFTGLAVDVGQMYGEQRHMQNTADAGALAGARELCLGHPASDAIAVAQGITGEPNNVLQVTAVVSGNRVTVTTAKPVRSLIAQLIGLASTDVRALGKAACGTDSE